MERSFRQYIHFFINDSSDYGVIARMVESDQYFPADEVPAKEMYTYMKESALYRRHILACGELYRKYSRIAEE